MRFERSCRRVKPWVFAALDRMNWILMWVSMCSNGFNFWANQSGFDGFFFNGVLMGVMRS